jgi:hypothetical protein
MGMDGNQPEKTGNGRMKPDGQGMGLEPKWSARDGWSEIQQREETDGQMHPHGREGNGRR